MKEFYDLDDYETGELTINIPIKKHWYQFWLPKTINYEYGSYVKIGNQTSVRCRVCQNSFIETKKED